MFVVDSVVTRDEGLPVELVFCLIVDGLELVVGVFV